MTSRVWIRSVLLLLIVWASAATAFAEDVGVDEDAGVPAAPSAAVRLVSEFGYAEQLLEQFEDVRDALNLAVARQAEAVVLAEQHDAARTRLRERITLLAEVAAIPDEAPAMQGRVGRLAVAQLSSAIANAAVDAADEAHERFNEEAVLLQEIVDEVAWQTEGEEAERQQRDIEQSLVDRENAARRAAEDARRREEATKDATLRQLFARERELREALVKVAEQTRVDSDLTAKTKTFEGEFQARQAELLGRIDALPANPLPNEKVELVDPLVTDLLEQRRNAWVIVQEARELLDRTERELAELTTERAAAVSALNAENARERELGSSDLWRQRVKVAEAQLEVIDARLDIVSERETRVTAHAKLLSDGIEFYSLNLREIIDRTSPAGRRLVYGLLDADTWSDAFHRLTDRIYRARALLKAGEVAESSIEERRLELLFWFGGMLGRVLFVAVLLMIGLRSVPLVSRKLLDLMMSRPLFRRRPSLAVKIFELLRITARPIVMYIGVSYVVSPIVNAVGELAFIQWAVDAIFTYYVGTRIAVTMALPRWYREREGMVSTGTEDDLKPEESAFADVLRMDYERGLKFVRSARIVLFVGTVWYYASDIVIAIVGVSVLSGLITNITKIAVVLVIIWMLSAWKDEFAAIFTRLAGDRLPEAAQFVARNKDRPWGVIVIGVVSVVVLVWELVRFVRRTLRDTDLAKRASAYAFKTKIELQQRVELTDEEIAELLPDDLEAVFDPTTPIEPTWFVERACVTELRGKVEPLLARGSGVVVVVSEPGGGRTTTCRELLRDHDVTDIHLDQRVATVDRLVEVIAGAAEVEASSLDELIVALEQAPPQIFYVDSFEQLYLREIGGYEAYRKFTELLRRAGRRHLFVIAANKFSWIFLSRVYDDTYVFDVIATLPRWSDEELRDLIDRRLADLPYSTSFSELADGGHDSEIVKTSRGYYRFLAQFSRGLPSTAMHYWTRSLTPGADDTFTVRLFPRPTPAKLVAAPADYRFFLASVALHGTLTAEQAAHADNTPQGTCELAASYFVDAGVLRRDEHEVCRLAVPLLPITLRHLEDSNLL